MKYSTIPRVSARKRRKVNPYIPDHERPKLITVRRPTGDLKQVRPCAYCGTAPGLTRDHVVPQSLFYRELPRLYALMKAKALPIPLQTLRSTVACCADHNILKSSQRLVPASWADRVEILNDLFPGTPWRVWSGRVDEPAYRDVHI